jgi:class 3 adenylate cyclase
VSGAEVEISFLFADVRRSSELARRLGTMDFTRLMQRFYATATEVFLDHNALLGKFIGDEAVGFFLPFMAGPHHPRRAVETAPNVAAHLAGQAGPGEILVTEDVATVLGSEGELERRHLSLKAHPVDALVVPLSSSSMSTT